MTRAVCEARVVAGNSGKLVNIHRIKTHVIKVPYFNEFVYLDIYHFLRTLFGFGCSDTLENFSPYVE
jgi:hypothetical protein